MSGLKLAALYGFYPHQFGFCGPKKNSTKKALLDYLSGEKIPEQKIRKILEAFRAAFSYYKLIAKSNGIKDPFDEKVVKAYWVGNKLLEKVSIDALREMIIRDFAKTKKIPSTSIAHHSFHVLVIGSITGRITLKDELLNICRVGWGKIIECKMGKAKGKNKAVIEYQPVQKKNKRYFLGKPIHKFVFWEKNFIPEIKIGDRIATHWNHIAQILNKRDLSNLKKYTQITIDSLND